MPTYEYRCPQCGYIEESTHKMDEAPDSINIKCKLFVPNEDAEARPCRLDRVMSIFSGSFGDTPKHHRR